MWPRARPGEPPACGRCARSGIIGTMTSASPDIPVSTRRSESARARSGALACALAVGLGAFIVLSFHRHAAASAAGIGQAGAPVLASVCLSTFHADVLDPPVVASSSRHAAFWVGWLSLAVGVAVVQWSRRVRADRAGGRCSG